MDQTTGSPSDCWMKLAKQVAFLRLWKVRLPFEWVLRLKFVKTAVVIVVSVC